MRPRDHTIEGTKARASIADPAGVDPNPDPTLKFKPGPGSDPR